MPAETHFFLPQGVGVDAGVRVGFYLHSCAKCGIMYILHICLTVVAFL